MTQHQKSTQTRQPDAEQRGFEKLGELTHHDNPLVRFLLRGLERFHLAGGAKRQDWVGDAEWAEIAQDPLRARVLLYCIIASVFALLIWSAFAELDEVTRGEGRVIPSRQLQVVQALDGGVITDLHVQEGDIVDVGDLLIQLDTTRSIASFQESRVQALALQARIARLEGLIENRPFNLDASIKEEIPEIAQREGELYKDSLTELQQRLSVFREQLAQRRKEHEEAAAHEEHARRNLALANRELQATRPLLRSGAVSQVDIIRLERDITGIEGDIAQTTARMGAIDSAIVESISRINEAETSMRNQWRSELSESLARLGSLDESAHRLADVVRSAEIRAPVRGIVQRLFYNTLGGVVTPGKEVLEIVPLDDQLLVEARIMPPDMAFLRPGLPAMVKLTAYDFAIYGGLEATLERLSADSITDDRGNTYFLARVRTTEGSLGTDLPVMPGMTAQVDILTGKKTVLSYLLKPVLRATSNAMTEK